MKGRIKKGLGVVLVAGVLAGVLAGFPGGALAVGDYEEDYTQKYYNSCSFSSIANASQSIMTWDDKDAREMEEYYIAEHGNHNPLTTSEMIDHAEDITGQSFYHAKGSDFTNQELLYELEEQLNNENWNAPFLITNEDILNLSDSDTNHYMNVVDVNTEPYQETVTYHDGNYYHEPETFTIHVSEFKDALESCGGYENKGIIFKE